MIMSVHTPAVYDILIYLAGTKPSANSDPWGTSSASTTQSLPKKPDPWAPPQGAGGANSTADPWGPAPVVKTSTSTGRNAQSRRGMTTVNMKPHKKI